ncbi:MAG: hypothetical protein OHK0015_31450 [Chloroflexi bacterium OHK40]
MTTFGIVLVAALVLWGLRMASLSLNEAAGARMIPGLAFVPVALLAAGLIAVSVGEAPAVELLRAAPLAAATLVTLLTRSLGYGLLAGLVVAAASMGG